MNTLIIYSKLCDSVFATGGYHYTSNSVISCDTCADRNCYCCSYRDYVTEYWSNKTVMVADDLTGGRVVSRKGTPDPVESLWNTDYIKNMWLIVKCKCCISIYTDLSCTMWIVGKRTATTCKQDTDLPLDLLSNAC